MTQVRSGAFKCDSVHFRKGGSVVYTVSLLGMCACLSIEIYHSFLVYCRSGNVF